MSDNKDFEIENGVLKKYTGIDGNVTIPESVTSIGKYAFYGCKSLKSITIPEGVTSIEDSVFKYCISLTSITIPESVTSIGYEAFSCCKSLTNITIPEGVTSIGDSAFSGCESLIKVVFPKALKKEFYKSLISYPGYNWPIGLVDMAEDVLKTSVYVFRSAFLKKSIWNAIDPDMQVRIYLNSEGKVSDQEFKKLFGKKQIVALSKGLLQTINSGNTEKELMRVAHFLINYHYDLSDEMVVQLYTAISEQKNSANAVKMMRQDSILKEKLPGLDQENDESSETEIAVKNLMSREGITPVDLKNALKAYCSLDITTLPELKDKDGNLLGATVLAWLLTKHDTVHPDSKKWNKSLWDKPGISEEAESVVLYLDKDSFQNALRTIASQCLGISGYDRRMFAAFPICRYADEELMNELTKRAPQWKSGVSGNEAPPLRTFREACCYSMTRSAMLFADKFHDLDDYARLRGMTAEELRDSVLSEVGLDENGKKQYDLGNQTVTVALQKDMSFSITLDESGKTVKSIPKKGADAEKYAIATEDFSRMKKDVKRIVKNRRDVLFEEFLNKTTKNAESWKKSYLKNPVLRELASLIVWKQKNHTFVLGELGPVTSNGKPYEILENDIAVAHPMEMKASDLEQWQKYFTKNHLKQPFSQIWEPVIDPKQIKEDRYKGVAIPYYRFRGMEKHGIHVQDWDYHNDIEIGFDGCDATVERLDWHRHEINNDDCFEVQAIRFNKYTRVVNHIIGYLDRITVYRRVMDDDIGVSAFLPQFTIAQITEFIKVASENNCQNVTALLLEYKNKNFGDYDPMDEFTLDL